MFRFESLEIYHIALGYADKIYSIVEEKFPSKEQFILSSQAVRAANSVVLNIAEGSSRKNKEFNRFLGMAIGSIFEIVACFQIALKRKYISEKEYSEIYNKSELLSKKINSFRKTLSAICN